MGTKEADRLQPHVETAFPQQKEASPAQQFRICLEMLGPGWVEGGCRARRGTNTPPSRGNPEPKYIAAGWFRPEKCVISSGQVEAGMGPVLNTAVGTTVSIRLSIHVFPWSGHRFKSWVWFPCMFCAQTSRKTKPGSYYE